MIGQSLALCAGLCAALASVCAKLAMASESTNQLCNSLLSSDTISSMFEESTTSLNHSICDTVTVYLRFTFFGLIFLFNALMWTLFTKSLQMCSTSIEATVCNTAANFFCTAVIGRLIFGEALSVMWFAGASLVILGLLIVHRGSSEQKEKIS